VAGQVGSYHFYHSAKLSKRKHCPGRPATERVEKAIERDGSIAETTVV
jgi:hypothetical protein